MITQALQTKIDHSIELLRKGEKLAFKMSPDGYYLAFSGGKDSQAIYQLAKERIEDFSKIIISKENFWLVYSNPFNFSISSLSTLM